MENSIADSKQLCLCFFSSPLKARDNSPIVILIQANKIEHERWMSSCYCMPHSKTETLAKSFCHFWMTVYHIYQLITANCMTENSLVQHSLVMDFTQANFYHFFILKQDKVYSSDNVNSYHSHYIVLNRKFEIQGLSLWEMNGWNRCFFFFLVEDVLTMLVFSRIHCLTHVKIIAQKQFYKEKGKNIMTAGNHVSFSHRLKIALLR